MIKYFSFFGKEPKKKECKCIICRKQGKHTVFRIPIQSCAIVRSIDIGICRLAICDECLKKYGEPKRLWYGRVQLEWADFDTETGKIYAYKKF